MSGKVGVPLTGLTTPVGWLLFLQLTFLSRSLCNRSFDGVFVLSLYFLEFSVGVGVCHRTTVSQISSFFLDYITDTIRSI